MTNYSEILSRVCVFSFSVFCVFVFFLLCVLLCVLFFLGFVCSVSDLELVGDRERLVRERA